MTTGEEHAPPEYPGVDCGKTKTGKMVIWFIGLHVPA